MPKTESATVRSLCAGCGAEGQPFLIGLVRSEDASGDGEFEADFHVVLCEACVEITGDLLSEFPRMIANEVHAQGECND